MVGTCRPWDRPWDMTEKLEVDPVAGSELQALVDQLSATPKEVIDLVRKISAR